MGWEHLIVLISALLAILLILKETRRKKRKNIVLRLVASILAVLALAFIALPPSYKTDQKALKKDFILLTEGFSKDSLAKFTNPVLITTDKKLAGKLGTEKPALIPSLDYYLAEHPNIQTLHILGSGLPDEELKTLQNIRLVLHPSEPPFGFSSVHWPTKIKSGENLSVAGTFKNNLGKPVKLILKSLSTTLDSAAIAPNSMADFKLKSTPRQLGLALSQLLVISGRDTLSAEKIPFEVEQSEPLKILLLASAPDFENKFLKNWLAGNDFSVAIRSGISKNKFSTEFVNMPALPLNNLQAQLLEKFDLLISDETALSQLSNSERLSVKNQVDAGLGLLIRNEDEESLPGNFSGLFTVMPMTLKKDMSIKLPDDQSNPLIIPENGIAQIRAQATDQPLVKDEKGHILVNSKMSGQGRIVFSTLNNTYTWKLSGNHAGYNSFWSQVIEKAVRKKQAEMNLTVAERFASIHQKNTILLQTGSEEIPDVSSGESRIYMEQDADLPNRWQGYFWPKTEGWNSVSMANDEKTSWFVYNQTDWQSIRKNQNLRATARFAKGWNKQSTNESLARKAVYTKIPAIFFYLLFLACCAYLWIETKFL